MGSAVAVSDGTKSVALLQRTGQLHTDHVSLLSCSLQIDLMKF